MDGNHRCCVSWLRTTPTPPPVVENVRHYDRSFDDVWQALVATYIGQGYPIHAIEKDSGVLTTEILGLPNPLSREFTEWAILPDDMFATYRSAQGTLNTHVRKNSENQTRVEVVSVLRVFEDNVTGQWQVCHSTGKAERLVLDGIAAKLPPKTTDGESQKP